jgi:hypothetical protein
MSLGIFSSWIENSIEKLAKLVPSRYAKYEESTGYIDKIDQSNYKTLTNPAPILVKIEAASAPVAAPVQLPVIAEPVSVPVAASAPVQTEVQAEAAIKPAPVKNLVKSKKTKKLVPAK